MLKRYFKVTLNLFFIKKFLMMTKKSYLYDRFFVLNRNIITENVKIIKNSWFFAQNFSTSGFFEVFF